MYNNNIYDGVNQSLKQKNRKPLTFQLNEGPNSLFTKNYNFRPYLVTERKKISGSFSRKLKQNMIKNYGEFRVNLESAARQNNMDMNVFPF